MVVLVSAEVFSGASLAHGLWSPWTLLVTYWLYFAHFFFLTTLAIRTGRTSLAALYLWGVLFGLYESWLTKVIWYGYSGDGTFAMGAVGPYGYSEISMVFFFHPLMSFIVPLAVACVAFPSLRQYFPEVAWFTGSRKSARAFHAWLIVSMGCIMAVNSGGPLNLAANLAFAVIMLAIFGRLSRMAPAAHGAVRIVAFRRNGFVGLCIYLGLLYGVMYTGVRAEGLPSLGVQSITFVLYALAIAGIVRQPRGHAVSAKTVEHRESRRVITVFAATATIALLLGALIPAAAGPVALLNLLVWPPLGVVLTLWCFAAGARQLSGRGE